MGGEGARLPGIAGNSLASGSVSSPDPPTPKMSDRAGHSMFSAGLFTDVCIHMFTHHTDIHTQREEMFGGKRSALDEFYGKYSFSCFFPVSMKKHEQ